MEKQTKTYRDILGFNNTAINWQKQNPAGEKLTGFQYALSRTLKSVSRHVEDYNDKQMDINVDCASTDEKNNIMIVAGNTVFTKEGSKDRNAQVRKLLDTEVEVEVHFAKLAPKDLTAFQMQAFEGFVMREPEEPKEEE